MARFSAREGSALRAIRDELATVRVGGPPVMAAILPEVRALLGTESMLTVRPTYRDPGWDVEAFHQEGLERNVEFRRRFVSFLDQAPRRYAWYDAERPEPEQRNRVMIAPPIPHHVFEASPIYQQVFGPVRLGHHVQLRVLVCDGPSLLTWFGALQPEPFHPRQHRLMGALVPAIRRRLAIESQLASFPCVTAGLEAALEAIGAPAFVVTSNGRVLEANSAGRALVERGSARVKRSLSEAVARRPAELPFELTPLRGLGTSLGWLAVHRGGGAEQRVEDRATSMATRWGLTRRQTELLRLLATGASNRVIGATLGISERTVEAHLTVMFEKVGVEGRSALVARVLAG